MQIFQAKNEECVALGSHQNELDRPATRKSPKSSHWISLKTCQIEQFSHMGTTYPHNVAPCCPHHVYFLVHCPTFPWLTPLWPQTVFAALVVVYEWPSPSQDHFQTKEEGRPWSHRWQMPSWPICRSLKAVVVMIFVRSSGNWNVPTVAKSLVNSEITGITGLGMRARANLHAHVQCVAKALMTRDTWVVI